MSRAKKPRTAHDSIQRSQRNKFAPLSQKSSNFVKFRQLQEVRYAKNEEKISETSLELSEKQLQFLQSDGATIEGLGVTAAEYNRWLKQPLFRILNELIDESLIVHDQIEDVLDEIKAAVLASQGFTYESIESRLDLYEGNLLEWTNSENDGELFREAVERFERELPETQERDRQIAERENATRANQTRAIQLILQGKNNQQIADAIGVSRQTVSFWQNQDENFQTALKDEIKAWQDAQRAKFASVIDTAYESLISLLQSDDPQIRLKAAVEVLKRDRSSHP